MAVNDFVSLLLGEAGGKNATERYNDMLHIASVVVNRSLATGLPVEDIIANSNEFNAWGKALPAGTEQFRSLAQQAIQQVIDHGPVTNATFYATPTKTDNLPGGLQAATRTASHEFFTDPENRSIGVVGGRYARVSPVSVETTPPVPLTAPRPYSPGDMRMMAFEPPYANLVPPTVAGQRELTPGAGLANLAPNGLVGAPTQYALGPGRSAPAHQVEPIIDASIKAVMGPDWTARVSSGTYTAGQWAAIQRGERSRTGSTRHDKGRAQDFAIVNSKTGEVLQRGVHDDQLRDIAREAASRGVTGMGFSKGYMDGDGVTRFHMDVAREGTWGARGRGRHVDPEMKSAFLNSRLTGVGALPNWYTPGGIPTPTPRDIGMAMPSVPSLPNFAGGASPVPAPSPMFGAMPMPSPPISASMAAPMPSPPIGPAGAVPMPGPMQFTAPPTVPPALAAFERQFNPNSARLAQEESMAMYRLGQPAVDAMIEDRPRSAPAVPAAVPPVNVPSPPRPDNAAYAGPKGAFSVPLPPSLPSLAPVPTPAPAPAVAVPEVVIPELAPIPTPAPRNAEASLLGGLMGPATKQIGQNVKTNMQGGRINVFAGIPQAYRDAFRGLGNRMDRMFGGSLPPPTPFSVGRGLSAIEAVRGGGMAPGATAYSNSHPGASWSVNAYGLPEFTSQHGFTGRTPDGF